MFNEEETTVVAEPFDDGEEFEISYRPMLSKTQLSLLLPSGLADRAEMEEVEARDIAYFEWIINEHIGRDFMEMVNSNDIANEKVVYLVEFVVSEIIGTEIEDWEERNSTDTSFLDSDTLGVQ